MKGLLVVAAIATRFVGHEPTSAKLITSLDLSEHGHEGSVRHVPHLCADRKLIADRVGQGT